MGSSLVQGFNYVRLGESTLTGAAATLDIQNIPSGYTFLVGYLCFELDAGGDILLQFNADAGANYDYQYHMAANAVISAAATGGTGIEIQDVPANHTNSYIININQISLNGEHGLNIFGGSHEIVQSVSGKWDSALEINRIVLTAPTNFKAGSRLILYGVR